MIIRRVKDFELENALRLIWEVFLKFEAPYFTEEGIKEFKDSIDNPSFIAKMDIFGAFNNNDDELLGIIATKEKNHISLFFVAEKYHKKGIGRLLYNHVCKLNPDGYFTVNSSPYAKKIYEKFGFTDISGEQCIKGIKFYRMKNESI